MLRFAESWSLSPGDSGKSERMVKEVFLSKSRCNIFLCFDLKLGAETEFPSSLAGRKGPVDMTSESSPREAGLSRRRTLQIFNNSSLSTLFSARLNTGGRASR